MDEQKLKEAKELIIQYINNVSPDADTRSGTVINELIAGLAALGYATISEELDSFEDKMYLYQALENPSSVDEDIVDAILSNFYIARKSGSKAQGLVKLEVDESRRYFVDTGSEFRTVEGLKYYSTSQTTVTEEDLFVTGNNFYFFVEAEAEAVGSKYTIAAGTAIETGILSGSLVTSEAFNDFHSGIDKESNEDLLGRVKYSLGARGLSNRQAINATLQEQFPDIRQLTTIGYNDREMQRDKNNIGFKVGGKADIYVRTQVSPLTKTIEKTADSTGKVTLDDLSAGEIPILRVRNIALASGPINTSDDFTVTVRSEKQYPNYYRFSIYEKLDIQTNYPDEDLVITVDYLPFIEDIQTYVDSDDVSYIRSDNLVKSYMPCFISMTINYGTTFDTAETEEAIRTSIINYINSYDSNILYVSKIIDQLHEINLTSIGLPLTLTGKFYLPDGSVTESSSDNSIAIEEDFDLGISNKTYRFFITPSDITLNREIS